MPDTSFAILIATKNRVTDLLITLESIIASGIDQSIITVLDDGSNDDTAEKVCQKFPLVNLKRNVESKGYLYCRNQMLNETAAEFAISLDDDANILSADPLSVISEYFARHPHCAVTAFRVFWGLNPPENTENNETPMQVKSFVGCGHAWRMSAWKSIPDYPEWFRFYGEEDFASYQLFRKQLEIHYLPDVLVHHRVNVRDRKKDSDYKKRLRSALRSGWFLIFLFYPINKVPRIMAYSLWTQFKLKVFKGDRKALAAILLALSDLLIAFPKIIRYQKRLSRDAFSKYNDLPDAKIYWHPLKG